MVSSAESMRKRRLKLKAAGKCQGCGAPELAGSATLCAKCLNALRSRRVNFIAAGKCARCGHPNDLEQFAYCSTCRSKRRAKALELKTLVIAQYGGSCRCCGDAFLPRLTIDHIENNGAAHRKETKGGGEKTYKALVKAGFPSGLQVLCASCNQAKQLGGECPH
jgi:hypothetical protein